MTTPLQNSGRFSAGASSLPTAAMPENAASLAQAKRPVEPKGDTLSLARKVPPSSAAGAAQRMVNPPLRPFTGFVRHVHPTPTPTKREFYIDELKSNFLWSWLGSRRRYRENLKDKPMELLKFAALAAPIAAGMTAFSSKTNNAKQFRVMLTFLMLVPILTISIRDALKTIPKMDRAYEKVKQGNPTQGREMFRDAMDDSVYSFFQRALRPVGVGFGLAMLLTLPWGVRKESQWMQNEIGRVLRTKNAHQKWPLKGILQRLENTATPIRNAGDRIIDYAVGNSRLVRGFGNIVPEMATKKK